jgi:tetratricopeptide (TPR) repeat protein
VFDDLHWADNPSLLLLRHLAARLPELALTVVGTYRDTEVHLDPERSALFVDLTRAGRDLRLAGLSPDELAQLVAGTTGGDTDRQWVETLAERTAGNPFFAKEVLRLLAARGGATDRSLASVPPSVVDVVVQRLARLPQSVTEVLELAAVTGERFTAGEVSGGGRPPEDVLDALDTAARAGLLAPVADGFAFTHALIQEAIYENLGPGRRAQLHRAAGLAAEEAGRPAEVLARHFVAAATLGEKDRAVRYGIAAGEAALSHLAHEDATAWFERVLTLCGPGTDNRGGLEALLGRAEVAHRSGDPDAARADLVTVVDAARRRAEPALLARAALGLCRLGGESGQLQPELIELLEDAVDALGDDEPDLRALALSALASELWEHARGREDDAQARSREALALAERAGSTTTLARCLEARYVIAWSPDLAGERTGVAQRMAEAARAAGDTELHAIAHLLHATALLELADPAWRAVLDRFSTLGSALRLPRMDFMVLSRQGAVAVMTGEFDTAERIIEEADELGRRIGEPDAFAVVSHLRWELARLAGSRGDLLGRELPARGETYLSLFGLVWPPLIHLDAGDPAGARAAHQVAAAVPLDEVRRSWIFLHNVADLAEAAVRLDDRETARRCYAALLPYSGMASVVSGLVCFGGAVDHHLGRLALALGDPGTAATHLRSAVELHRRLGARPWAEASRALLAQAGTAAAPGGSLVREAKVWRVAWGGKEAHVPDAKGVRDLAILLSRPGQEVHAAELYGTQATDRGAEVVDRQAVAAYQQRLADLDRELADAEADHDLGRAERAAVERDSLIEELRRTFDLHGRPRRMGDTGERARKAVSARLREAIGVIGAAHPDLGAHLRDAVRTGTFCSYRPAEATAWEVRQI